MSHRVGTTPPFVSRPRRASTRPAIVRSLLLFFSPILPPDLRHARIGTPSLKSNWDLRESDVNQADLRTLTEERIQDAQALIDAKRWAFAYYVAGYAVECALKSCVLARMVHTGWVFQDKIKADDCKVHDFMKLIGLAGLEADFRTQMQANRGFQVYWAIVKDWEPTARYVPKGQAEAQDFFEAVTHDPNGVLLWIKRFW